ncbi:hypothetical protein ACLFKU_44915, partial [Paraburkholderia sp. EG304]
MNAPVVPLKNLGTLPEQAAPPLTSEIVRVWHDDRSVGDGSAMLYLRWIRYFRDYCEQCGLDERA